MFGELRRVADTNVTEFADDVLAELTVAAAREERIYPELAMR